MLGFCRILKCLKWVSFDTFCEPFRCRFRCWNWCTLLPWSPPQQSYCSSLAIALLTCALLMVSLETLEPSILRFCDFWFPPKWFCSALETADRMHFCNLELYRVLMALFGSIFSIQLEVKPILTYRTISSLLYFWSSLQTWNYTKFFCSSFQNHPHVYQISLSWQLGPGDVIFPLHGLEPEPSQRPPRGRPRGPRATAGDAGGLRVLPVCPAGASGWEDASHGGARCRPWKVGDGVLSLYGSKGSKDLKMSLGYDCFLSSYDKSSICHYNPVSGPYLILKSLFHY